MSRFDTPVVLVLFNRPELTARVFAEIARVQPSRLLAIADGPRPDRPGEDQQCALARAVLDRVDWPCTLETQFSDRNLGCRVRLATGLTWAFSRVDEAIILEDDCLPDPSFFPFCAELLARFRDDERIAQIGGINIQPQPLAHASYYASRYNHIWGWASWRRAWQHYDVTMSSWPQLRDRDWLGERLGHRGLARYWSEIFERTYQGDIDTWDYQWIFASWRQDMLTLLPAVNLVSNLGFGADATHTRGPNRFSACPTVPMRFPLCHPKTLVRDTEADAYTEAAMFRSSPLRRMRQALVRRLRRFYT